jgi:hypothetical protein
LLDEAVEIAARHSLERLEERLRADHAVAHRRCERTQHLPGRLDSEPVGRPIAAIDPPGPSMSFVTT